MKNVLLLGGKRRSGKDHTGALLISRFGFHRVSYGTALKNIIYDILCISFENGEVAKNLNDSVTLNYNTFLQKLYKHIGIINDSDYVLIRHNLEIYEVYLKDVVNEAVFNDAKAELINNTTLIGTAIKINVRMALQHIASMFKVIFDPEIWTRICLHSILNCEFDNIVATDFRFPYDSVTHSITFSNRPYNLGILAQHGVFSNRIVLAITKNSNGIELYNASTYVNNASITIPAQYSLSKVLATGNYDNTSIIMDNDYLYVLAYNITSDTPHILKYLLLDQSLVSNLELTGYKKSVNTHFKFIGGKIALTVNENNIQNKIKLIFLNTTLEVISDSSEYFAPIVLGEGYIPQLVIRDLGGEKILINLGTLTKIYTYDGYQIFSLNETDSLYDITALNESTLYYAYYSTDSVALKLNPIYKYR